MMWFLLIVFISTALYNVIIHKKSKLTILSNIGLIIVMSIPYFIKRDTIPMTGNEMLIVGDDILMVGEPMVGVNLISLYIKCISFILIGILIVYLIKNKGLKTISEAISFLGIIFLGILLSIINETQMALALGINEEEIFREQYAMSTLLLINQLNLLIAYINKIQKKSIDKSANKV